MCLTREEEHWFSLTSCLWCLLMYSSSIVDRFSAFIMLTITKQTENKQNQSLPMETRFGLNSVLFFFFLFFVKIKLCEAKEGKKKKEKRERDRRKRERLCVYIKNEGIVRISERSKIHRHWKPPVDYFNGLKC